MLKMGDVMPDTRLPDQQGEERRLQDLLGKRGGIIYFYPRDSTPGCTIEANDFQALLTDFAALGLTVTGISKDSVASHGRFCLKQGLTFTLLSDENGEVCSQFGVWQEKTNYGRTSMGIVRTTFVVNADGVVQHVYRNVKTAGHGMQVLLEARAAAG
ncbi:MAG: thioredoxin-dependent thiol peroxidase [Magnetococcales bacterium]|nr:thioredoxin-dependent thiol peroxidase [Magnetococcales bacterium]